MLRYFACLAVALLGGAFLRAGELDADFKPAAPPAPAAHEQAFLPANALGRAALAAQTHDAAPKASELDEEAPAQSWCGFRGGWGCGFRGCGWGGFGWRGCGFRIGWGCGWRGCGWGGWGCYRPCFAFAPVCFSVGFCGSPCWGGFCW